MFQHIFQSGGGGEEKKWSIFQNSRQNFGIVSTQERFDFTQFSFTSKSKTEFTYT